MRKRKYGDLRIAGDGSIKIWHDFKRWVETEPCHTFGCKHLKAKGSAFCPSCCREFEDDPDAFK